MKREPIVGLEPRVFELHHCDTTVCDLWHRDGLDRAFAGRNLDEGRDFGAIR